MAVADPPDVWVEEAFGALPGTADDLFRALWGERRLRFGRSAAAFDPVDERSARLVCAAVTSRQGLYIGLPDDGPHRAGALFATALLRDWMNARSGGIIGRQRPTVLYFGTTTGIREHLRQISVHGWNLSLAEVLGQTDLARGGRDALDRAPSRGTPVGTTLPRVVTVYAPADPGAVLDQHRPCWIAVDCDDIPVAGWLAPLLKEAARRAIPVLAWGHNPLSECVGEFTRAGVSIFSWPHSLGRVRRSPTPQNLATLLLPCTETELLPTVLQGEDVDRLQPGWANAARLLARAAHRAAGPHAQETVRVHWRYLRALEQLTVPYVLHEAEAARLWGLHSFQDLHDACEAFRRSLAGEDRALSADLRQALVELAETASTLQQAEAPLWTALYGLAIDDPPRGEARLITFTSWARKQLFLFALLAEIGLSEEDLVSRRICVASLGDLLHLQRRRRCLATNDPLTAKPLDNLLSEAGLTVRPVLVGLPGASTTPKLMPLLRHEEVEVLLYPHQASVLAQRSDVLVQALDGLDRTLGSLGALAGRQPPHVAAPPARVRLRPPTGLEAQRGRRTEAKPVTVPWEAEAPSDLITRLLQADDDEEAALPLDHTPGSEDAARRDGVLAWCEQAIEVRCEGGWLVRLPLDETINVVLQAGGTQVHERSVRSLRPGERVLLIYGHKRQSLYDLIVSRLHSRPGMELHLGLIRQWYVEFAAAFERWRAQDKSLEDVLDAMQRRGSRLTSVGTLRSWLRGYRLCPSDPADLPRLAEVLQIEFLRVHYRRVSAAASMLRGLHRSLSNRLNRWLERQAAGVVYAGDDEPIDPESGLGLTFGDFRSSILVTQVNAVRTLPGPFLRSTLGSLEREAGS